MYISFHKYYLFVKAKCSLMQVDYFRFISISQLIIKFLDMPTTKIFFLYERYFQHFQIFSISMVFKWIHELNEFFSSAFIKIAIDTEDKCNIQNEMVFHFNDLVLRNHVLLTHSIRDFWNLHRLCTGSTRFP